MKSFRPIDEDDDDRDKNGVTPGQEAQQPDSRVQDRP